MLTFEHRCFISISVRKALKPFSAEFLRDHCPQAAQTARQATDALHAVQPEGKQEGKTPTVSAFAACALGGLSGGPCHNEPTGYFRGAGG